MHKDVQARLASIILYLLDNEGVMGCEGYEIPNPYIHEQIGIVAMIGAKRAAVTRAFSRPREAGAVEVARRRIRPRSLEEPRRIASEEKRAFRDRSHGVGG